MAPLAETGQARAWILTDWQVEIYRRPRYCIPLQIQTWQRAARATFALFREYLVSDGQPAMRPGRFLAWC